MKVLIVFAALLVYAQATKRVNLPVKGEAISRRSLCSPLRPVNCNRNCPRGSRPYLDGCNSCACVAVDQPTCRKLCPTHFELFAPCHCVQVDYLSSPVDREFCNLPAETGMCRGYFPKYFFNSNTGRCESFVYGGCGGNANNFNSQTACEQACL